MSAVLQIRHVRIRTDDGWQEPYDLDAPVVAIVGPVDTGKSSLLDCIAFTLGRETDEFRGAVHRLLREVEIGLRVGSGAYILRRARRTCSYVEVLDAAGTPIGRFPVKSPDGQQTISSWLLEQVGLDNAFASVRLPGGKSIDFPTSLLSYCYLTQGDIDRHIIQPARQDAARLVALKLLFNLTTPEHERLNGKIRDVDNDIEKRRRKASMISEFLAESQVTNPDVLRDEIAQLKVREADAARRLATWKNDARAASSLDDHDRQRVIRARKDVSDAEESLDRARRQRETAHARVAALEKSLAVLTALEERSPEERRTLHLVHAECPACESSLSDRVSQPGCCYLCGQLLPGVAQAAERRRLQSEHETAAAAERELGDTARDASTRADDARGALAVILKEVNARAGDTVTPFVDAIAAASGELAGIRAELASLGRIQGSHHRLGEQFSQIAQMEAEQEARRHQARQQAELEPAENVLDAVNGIFQRIVRGIDLPYATGLARLDSESLLPLVDEQEFAQRGGGARSAVSIAYSLTLLTYTLENALARLPALLMIDSPQKNFGANKDDKALAHRVYERFLDYMAELSESGDHRFRRKYQLIIVDNDIHADIRRRIKVHQFERDKGFIRNLEDPHALPRQPRQLNFDTV
jgi:hypothetical protein